MSEVCKRKAIDFVEINIRGAWVVWGIIGIRQYYYYTKKEAVSMYMQEVKTNGPIICKPV